MLKQILCLSWTDSKLTYLQRWKYFIKKNMFSLLLQYSCLKIYFGNALKLSKISLISIKNEIEDTITNVNSTITSAKYIINALPDIIESLQDVPDLTKGLTATDIISYTISGLTNEDAHTDVLKLIEKYGYKCENHTVETNDGYLLSLVRIPGAGKPVFVMHGFLNSCDDFVTAGNETGLAFILAAEGYDVWMGNARGTKHSINHKTLPIDSKEYWDFSWHEIGMYDLPAMIDYTLNVTNQNELIYIGHSQATTALFVMTSELTEYNEKISIIISLATVAWMSHIKSVVYRALVPLHEYYAGGSYGLGEYKFVPSVEILQILSSAVCSIPLPLCSNILFLIAGFSYDQIDMERLPVIVGHTPSSASMKQFVHYAQLINSGEFRKFDHGDDKNMQIYGTKTPPSYAVENITAPIYMFHTNNDWLSNITDVNILRRKIPNEVGFYVVPHPTFNHLDYLYGKDVVKLVYNKILDVIKDYKTNDTEL